MLTHSSFNTKINPIEVKNVKRGAIQTIEVNLLTCELRNYLLKKYKTLKFEGSDVWKLKEVTMTPHWTLIGTCFCTLAMFLWYSSSIFGYVSIATTSKGQLYKEK